MTCSKSNLSLQRYILLSALLHGTFAFAVAGYVPKEEEVQYSPIQVQIVNLHPKAEKKTDAPDYKKKKKRRAQRHKKKIINHNRPLSSEKTTALLPENRKKEGIKLTKKIIAAASVPSPKNSDTVSIQRPIEFPVQKRNIQKKQTARFLQKPPITKEEKELGEPIPLDTKDNTYSEYFASIKRKIEQEWSYPEEAAMLGLNGKLRLKFILEQNGTVAEVELVDTSGHYILDDEAITAIKQASPYNRIPTNIQKDRLPIIATFNYFSSYDMVPVDARY